jgi:Tol biopolymer transport system component
MTRALALSSIAAVCALVALAALTGSARATYPGATNGRLAFGMNVNGNTDVYTALPNGRDLRRLTTDPGFDACAAYSADGNRIAYCSGKGGGPVQVWTMKPNGTDKQQVTNMGVTAIFPDFSPDGSKIVFCAGASTFARDVYVVNSDGSGLIRLTSGVGNNVYPAFSPDGRKIVFTSNRTGTSQVWVMNADGTDQTQLTFDSQPKDQVPDWSPDGSKIAYLADAHGVADMGNSWGDIWVMNADGSGQHPLTSGGSWYGTAWSPDGSRIATLDFPSRTVYTISASNGGDPQAVHPEPGIQFVPGWQPRGTDTEDLQDAAGMSNAVHVSTIRVSTHNSRYVLSARTAPRGVVVFKISNPASEPHDLSINGRTSKLLRTGQSTTLRVAFHRKGRYSYKDTFDHHAQFGCRGGFRIT